VKKGEQKGINPTKKRGKRLSILGIWKDKDSFQYGLKLGGFKTKPYIEIIN